MPHTTDVLVRKFAHFLTNLDCVLVLESFNLVFLFFFLNLSLKSLWCLAQFSKPL